MNCRRAKKLIFEFVDGLTDEKLQLDLEQHIGGCAECEKLATSLSGSLALIRHTPQEPVDENFNWKVRLAIRKERSEMQDMLSSQGSLFRAWNIRYAMSAAAGFAAILAAGWLTISLTAPSPAGDELLTSAPRPAQQQQETEASNNSPTILRPSPTATGPGTVVSGGNNAARTAQSGRPYGAIDDVDVVNNPAAFDSLFQVHMQDVPEDVRVRILEQHMMHLQKRLDACRTKKHE